MSAKEFTPHDHDQCKASTLAAAEARCEKERLQLTPVRRRVLEILLEDHRAMGAYEVLDVLATEGLGSQPPVAYRALDFLVRHGFVHRIERLNAFAACTHPERRHAPVFLICRACRQVAETDAALAEGQLGAAASQAGFTIERVAVEAEGLCTACTGTAP